ncbi:MAG: Ig domain-containing protein, partial [Gaiellaceae bacterium]
LAATGGVPPYTWSRVSGKLPNGLSLSSSGTISGTPTKRGTYTFKVRVRDSVGTQVSKSFSIQINRA